MVKVKKYLLRLYHKYSFLFKRYYYAIMVSEKSDHMIALSFAIGTEVAIFPTPGFSTAIGFGLLAIFKQLNKMAVFISMLIWNAFTVLPIYWLSYQVGNSLNEYLPEINTEIEWLASVILFFKQFAIGNLMVTIPISILSYFIARILLSSGRKSRWKRKHSKV